MCGKTFLFLAIFMFVITILRTFSAVMEYRKLKRDSKLTPDESDPVIDAPKRPSGTIKVEPEYVGRSKPVPVDDPHADEQKG